MRLPFGEMRSNPYMCCFCCHVRLGTVLLGIISLVVDLLAVSISIMFVSHPDYYQRFSSDYALLYDIADEGNSTPSMGVANTTTAWLASCSDDRFVGLILTIGSAMVTVGLLYGTIKGYPRYLLPFFCLQVFDFVVTSLSVVGYFSYAPNIRLWIMRQKWFPMKDQLVSMDTTFLLLIAAVTAVIIMWLKAYCISIVWNCYKFLNQGQGQSGRMEARRQLYDVEMVHFEGGQPLNFMPATHPHSIDPSNVVVLPPKYEDLEVQSVSSEPPPYCAAYDGKEQDH